MTNKPIIPKFKPTKKNIIISLVVIFGVIVVSYTIYLGFFYNRVLANTFLGESNIGGKTEVESKDLITAKIKSLPESLQLKIQDKSYPIKYSTLSFNLPVDENNQKIFNYGRSNNVAQNIFTQLKGPVLKNKLTWDIEYDSLALSGEINSLVGGIDNQFVNPSISVQDGNFVKTDGKSGLFIDRQKLISQIQKGWREGQFDEIVYQPSEMNVDSINQDYGLLATELNKYNNPITINAEGKTKVIDSQILKKWLTIVRDTEKDDKIGWEFNVNNIYNQLQGIAEEIKTDSRNAKLAFVDNAVVVVSDSVNGKKMDVEAGISLILNGIKSQSKQVDVPVVTVPAEVTRQNYNTLGIKEIIGTATTNFKGSTSNRKHNVANGASILSGTIVKPGAEFSTAAVMGDVSDVTGFLPELVIKGDHTTPEFGGGLCQVSTTLFRSVLNAGLRVSERQNHSYRVAYYEPPLGLDATIYFPHPDFRFVNDTTNYVLVQSKIAGTLITFELYGTKDGRSSVIQGPDLLATAPAGDPKYIPSDTLFKGETKQTEKPHDGATTKAVYIVNKDGKELFRQTFKSVYKPWPAQFLVGTKDPPAPTPVPEPVVTPTPAV